jgi:curli biogenesis system outer membrane secretion channel CsgG
MSFAVKPVGLVRTVGVSLAVAVSATVGSARAEDPSGKVEKCGKSLGSIAVVEPQVLLGYLGRVGLGSPSQMLRLMIQESGCFDVVERGVAMQNLQQERALAAEGQMRAGSNVGAGQMQAADFVLTPAVQFSEGNTGGVGGPLLGRLGGVLGAVAGSLKFKEAETSIVVADVRSGIQVASAVGQSTKVDFGVGGFSWLGGAAGGAGGFTRTPEGRVITASLLDNYNKIVVAIRDKPQLIATRSAASDANARASTQAGAPIEAGQMLAARLPGVRVFAEPRADSKVLGTLQPSDPVVASGEAEGSFIKIDTAQIAGGWVQRNLVAPPSAPAGRIAAAPPPVAMAATPPALAVPADFASSRAGAFTGTFSGGDSGNIDVRIVNGDVEGTIDARDAGVLMAIGRVDASGNVSFQGESRSHSYLMRGSFDASQTKVVGTCRTVGDGPQRNGEFVMERRR